MPESDVVEAEPLVLIITCGAALTMLLCTFIQVLVVLAGIPAALDAVEEPTFGSETLPPDQPGMVVLS